ncbi:MAG: hypothetical protein QXJ58_06675 [Archaeoglobaceae archaeon]
MIRLSASLITEELAYIDRVVSKQGYISRQHLFQASLRCVYLQKEKFLPFLIVNGSKRLRSKEARERILLSTTEKDIAILNRFMRILRIKDTTRARGLIFFLCVYFMNGGEDNEVY